MVFCLTWFLLSLSFRIISLQWRNSRRWRLRSRGGEHGLFDGIQEPWKHRNSCSWSLNLETRGHANKLRHAAVPRSWERAAQGVKRLRLRWVECCPRCEVCEGGWGWGWFDRSWWWCVYARCWVMKLVFVGCEFSGGHGRRGGNIYGTRRFGGVRRGEFVCWMNGLRKSSGRVGHASGMALRWRREDFDSVKHDKYFSEWKVSTHCVLWWVIGCWYPWILEQQVERIWASCKYLLQFTDVAAPELNMFSGTGGSVRLEGASRRPKWRWSIPLPQSAQPSRRSWDLWVRNYSSCLEDRGSSHWDR